MNSVAISRLADQLWTERTGADFYVAQNVGFLLETATVRIPDAEVVALYDVDRERCENAIRRINGQQDQAARPGGPEPPKLQAKVYTDYGTMLDEAGLHAVYVCVPPFAHGDLELKTIDAGLALFVEKPVALSVDLGRQIAQAIKGASTAHSRRCRSGRPLFLALVTSPSMVRW